jgi:hypothetical protein
LLGTPFISLWVGQNYTLDFIVLFSLILHFYINGCQFTPYTYRTTMGLFVKGRYAPVAAAIINIVLSILLAKWIGLCGIFFATSISRLCTMFWVDPHLIYKYKFNKSAMSYFIRYFIYFAITVIAYFITYGILSLIDLSGILGFIVSLIVCVLVINSIFIVVYFKTKEYKYLFRILKAYVNKIINRGVTGVQ